MYRFQLEICTNGCNKKMNWMQIFDTDTMYNMCIIDGKNDMH